MIADSDIISIGELHKPHGVRGEMSATLDTDRGLDPAGLRCVVLTIDGIPVPFFIECARRRGAAAWLIKLEGVDSEAEAAVLSNHDIFALRGELPEDPADDAEGMYLSDLAGYEVIDVAGMSSIGTIDDVDDSTANTLLIIRRPDGRLALIPYSDELLLGFDTEAHTITLEVPPGVLDLND